MKKINVSKTYFFQNKFFAKLFMVMKITVLLLLFAIGSVFAKSTYSQNTRLSLHLENATLQQVFDEIQKKSEFIIFYKDNQVDVNHRSNVDLDDVTVEQILNQALISTDLGYKIIDRQIVILADKSKVSPSTILSESNSGQQKKEISGTVKDPKGFPLPGVSVVVKGTTIGTVSDSEGKFKINVPSDSKTLVFSFVGMKTQEIVLGKNNIINISLAEDAVDLDEVVTIGYGTQKKTSLIGSVSTVASEALENRSVTNVETALQGRVPGLTISSTNGQPGSEGVSMNIRGMNSWATNSSPLVLIDGVPGDMQQLSPDVIDNIAVLKDALSAAIYGARAANGVILVTTKRGVANKIQITYNAMFSSQAPTKKYKSIQDPVEFMKLYNTAEINTSGDPNYNVLYKDADIALFQNGTYKGTNWNNYLYRENIVQEHRIGLSGGNERAKFNLGLSYSDQPGIIKNFNNKKYNFYGNYDIKVNDFISAGGSTNFTRGYFSEPSWGITNIMILSLDAKPTYNPTYVDPVTGETKIMRARWSKEGQNRSLYDQLNFDGSHTKMSDAVNLQAFVNVTPIKGLVWQTKVATFYTHNYDKSFNIVESNTWYEGDNSVGSVYNPGSNSLTINQPWEQTNTLYSTVSYNRNIAKHNIGIMLGYEVDHNISQSMSAYRNNYQSSLLQELNAGATTAWSNSGTSSEWGLQSYFGRFNYDYAGKYLLESDIRRDESSRFAPGLKAAIFPSVGLGWVVSKENFMKQLNFISNLKLRAAWGRLGNQDIGNYPYQSTYGYGSNYDFNSLSTGVTISGLVNQNLTWETTTTKNAGLDLNIKNGLFSLSFEYYNKLTSGILRGAQVTATLGLNAPTVNNGSMQNTGFDLVMGHKKQITDKFNYWVNMNLSVNKSKVVSFGAEEIGGNTIIKEGQEYGAYYMYKMVGIYQTNDPDIQKLKVDGVTQHAGQIKYKDVDGDGNITSADRQIVGNKFPRATFGINLGAQYGNFDFSAFIYGVERYSGYQQFFGFEPFSQGGPPNVFWRNAWTPQNKSNSVPQIYNMGEPGGNWYNTHPSTFFLQDLSFMRLKNIQIGYSLPKSLIRSTPIQSVRFYFSGDNLLSHFNNKNAMADPETNQDNSFLNNRYPQLKTYTFGLSVKF